MRTRMMKQQRSSRPSPQLVLLLLLIIITTIILKRHVASGRDQQKARDIRKVGAPALHWFAHLGNVGAVGLFIGVPSKGET